MGMIETYQRDRERFREREGDREREEKGGTRGIIVGYV